MIISNFVGHKLGSTALHKSVHQKAGTIGQSISKPKGHPWRVRKRTWELPRCAGSNVKKWFFHHWLVWGKKQPGTQMMDNVGGRKNLKSHRRFIQEVQHLKYFTLLNPVVIFPSLLTYLAKFDTMGSVSSSWKLLVLVPVTSHFPGLSVFSTRPSCPPCLKSVCFVDVYGWSSGNPWLELLSVQATIISYPDILQQPSYCFLFSFVLRVWPSLFLCIPASAHVMGTCGLFLLEWNKCWLPSTLSPFLESLIEETLIFSTLLVPLTWMLHKVIIRAKVIVQHGVLFLLAQTMHSIYLSSKQHLLLFSPPSMG